jgi:hypothetical protein
MYKSVLGKINKLQKKKFRFIWLSGFTGEYYLEIVQSENESVRNWQSL